MDLEGFEPVILTNGPSTMTVAKSGVSFSQSTVLKLHKAKYVKLLMDKDRKMIAVQETDKDDTQAVPFYNPKRKIVTARWNYSDFNNTLSNLMNWDTKKSTYKVQGTYLEKEKAMVFNLDEAKVLRR